jgi:hypothetical protein
MTNKHAPVDTQWTAFVEYLREHGIEIEAIDAEVKRYARKRSRRLAAAYRRRRQQSTDREVTL